MSLMAKCTACGQRFAAPSQFAGKRVKCKACGEIFVVADVSAPEVVDGNEAPEADALSAAAQFESKTKVKASAYGQPGRIGAKNEKRIERSGEADPFEFKDAEVRSDLRPNVLIFNFPYAWQLDQWLPLGLIVLSLGIYALFAGQQEVPIRWVALTRALLPMLLYGLVIGPITLRMLKKAGDALRFQMPPQVTLRGYSAFTPAFAFTAGLWLVSDSVVTAVLAIVIGLGVSSVALWMLFRVREPDLPTTIGYGAGGFGIGVAASIVLVLLLNLVTGLIVTASKAQSSVPISPFGPELAWIAVPQNEPTVAKPTEPTVVHSNTVAPPAATSAVAQFEENKIPGLIDEVIQPFSAGNVIGILRKLDNNAVSVEAWDMESWHQMPGPLQLPARPSGRFVMNTNGQRLAWIAEFPHLSIQVWAFASATVVSTIDLDRSLGEPRLLGFTSSNNLLVEWLPTGSAAVTPTAKEDPKDPGAASNPAGGEVVVGSRVFDTTEPPPQVTPAPAVPVAPTSAAPTTASVADTPAVGPTLELISVPARSSMLKFKIPPLAAAIDSEEGRAVFAVSTAAQRFVAAAKTQSTNPTLFQFDLKTGEALPSIKISDVDPTMSPAPTGLAYSGDGKQIAVMFEHAGSALVLTYDAATGQKVLGNVYPAGPLNGAAHDPFRGTAIVWLDPWPYWLVYGRGLLNTQTGTHVGAADLSVAHTIGQRVLDGGRVQLLTGGKDGVQITVATINKDKLDAAATPASAN